jgi:valyl-tRNA synthetase
MFNGAYGELTVNAFTPKFSCMEEGAKVDVLAVGDLIVTVAKK